MEAGFELPDEAMRRAGTKRLACHTAKRAEKLTAADQTTAWIPTARIREITEWRGPS